MSNIIPTDIKQAFAAHISNTVDPYKLEIEFRFSEYFQAPQERRDRDQHRGVNFAAFHRLKNHAQNRKWRHEFTSLIDYTQTVGVNKYRKSINQKTNEVSWNEKKLVKNYDHLSHYYIRLGVNTERELNFIPDFVEANRRIKYRDTYYINNLAKLDLTYVEMDTDMDIKKQNDKEVKRYEVELEIIDLTRLNEIEPYVLEILRVIQDTKHLYNYKQYQEIISFVNRTLNPSFMGPQSSIQISDWNLHQARNLKFQDVVWGGLVGNEKYSYRVTIKADGLRKLLVFHHTGIWMVMAPGNANLIWKNYQDELIIPEDYVAKTNLNGYILEGEYIPMENRTGTAPACEYLYYAFDVLAVRPADRALNNDEAGLTDVQKRPHHERMRPVFDVIERLFSDSKLLTILGKKFRSFYTVEEFYRIMRQMDPKKLSYPFIDDGYIFMPDEMPYDYPVQSLKRLTPRERTLTKYPDICKWKPKKKLTIDFAIGFKFDKTINLLVGDQENFESLITEVVNIDHKHPLLYGLNRGAVVEFKFQNNTFVPVRVRGDKQFPNSRKVAIDTWHQIIDPIEMDTLKGLNLQLTRKLNNRIKTGIYSEIKGENLLEIGSGYGGDQNKWYNIGLKKIVAVEPNPDNNQEFIRRLKTSKYRQQEIEIINDESDLWKVQTAISRRDNVILVQTGGENSNLITQVVRLFMGKADAVTSMLSLSFFWLRDNKEDSDWKLNGLIETIKNNTDGEFHYFTIDGDLVEEYMRPVFGGPEFDTIRLYDGLAEIRYSSLDKEVEIYLKDSIVGKGDNDEIVYQKEGLVKIDDLILRLTEMEHSNYSRADQEGFLSPGGALLSSMYAYGKFIPKKNEEKKYLENKNQLIEMTTQNTPVREIISPSYPIGVDQPILQSPSRQAMTTLPSSSITQLSSFPQPIAAIPSPSMAQSPSVPPPMFQTPTQPTTQPSFPQPITTISSPSMRQLSFPQPIVQTPIQPTTQPIFQTPIQSITQPPLSSQLIPPRAASPPRLPSAVISPPRLPSAVISPPRVSPPRVSPPVISPPRVSPPRVSPPRVSPPVISPPRVSPPRLPSAAVSPPRVSPVISPPRTVVNSPIPPISSPPPFGITQQPISISPSVTSIPSPFGVTPVSLPPFPTSVPPQFSPQPIKPVSIFQPPQSFPPQSFPPHPSQSFPPQPSQSFPPQSFPPQSFPPQSFPPQPSQSFPPQPSQSFPPQSFPPRLLPPGLTPQPPGLTHQPLPPGLPSQPLPPGLPSQPPGLTPQPLPPGLIPQPLPPGLIPQPPGLTPQPLPPGLTPQPLPPGLTPQPLPPGLPPQPPGLTLQPPGLTPQPPGLTPISQTPQRPVVTLQPVSAPQQIISIPERDKFRREGRLLPSIRLTYDEITREVYGDNKVETINCSWYKQYNIVRIASAGPKTCFLECVMNAVNPQYANTRSYLEKQQKIANLKSDLVDGLSFQAADNKTHGDILTEKTGYDYNTLVRMIRMEEGYDTVLLAYICELISLTIYTFEIHEFDLIYKNQAGQATNVYGIILLGKSQSRYELIGVDKGQSNIQTVFNSNDEIIIANKYQKFYNDIINHVYKIMDKLKQRVDWSEVERRLIDLGEGMTEISQGQTIKLMDIYQRLYDLIKDE